MKISRATGYALLALGYIAKNQEDRQLVSSQEIAEEYNIPLQYLLKIMQQLVRANILRSKRGPRGGFSLAKLVNKISMLDIIEAVEGPVISDLDISEIDPINKFCNKAEKAYQKAVGQAVVVYKKTKLSDLI